LILTAKIVLANQEVHIPSAETNGSSNNDNIQISNINVPQKGANKKPKSKKKKEHQNSLTVSERHFIEMTFVESGAKSSYTKSG
jgi:hypothetical protein